MSFVDLTYRIEYEWFGRPDGRQRPLVLLHHGLGSVSAWRDFPGRVAEATGESVLVYSRLGYGRSTAPAPAAWPVDFMHREALGTLPRLLEHFGITAPTLVGHSDGASIALIQAGSDAGVRPRGLVLMAPHVFVEQVTVDSAHAARAAFDRGALRERLARHHARPEVAFRGWYGAWTRPGFRTWNLEAYVERVACPMAVIQGTDDEYGTLEQVRRIVARARLSPRVAVLPGCGHAPYRDRPDETLRIIAEFVARLDRR